MGSEFDQTKRPLTVLAGLYGHPVHPALIPIPIGAWTAAAIFDVGSYVVDDPGFLVRGATWLIVIGIIGALTAGMAGFLDMMVIPTRTRAYRTVLWHLSLNLSAVLVFTVDALVHRDLDLSDPVGVGPLLLTMLGLLVMGSGAFLGGELVFHWGVRVAHEEDQVHGFEK